MDETSRAVAVNGSIAIAQEDSHAIAANGRCAGAFEESQAIVINGCDVDGRDGSEVASVLPVRSAPT